MREGERVQVVCQLITPLMRGELAIRIPTLKGESCHPNNLAQASVPGPPKPVVADLLPLLLASFDNRLDTLKEWIIYLHVNSMSNAQFKEGQAARAVRQREAFFSVLQKLVPGGQVKYGEVDLGRWQVFLSTLDGKIPLEQVSQGVTSLFGWIHGAAEDERDLSL